MKKRKILVLFPLLGLFLSGCTFQEGLAATKSFIGDKIYHPIKDWFNGVTGKKEEQKSDDQKSDEQGGSSQDEGGKTTPEEKTLASVAVKSVPEFVMVGATLSPSKVKLTATYSDASTEDVSAEKVVLDTSVAGAKVEGTAEYKGKTATFTIEVREAKETEHAGTLADPYTISDAKAVYDTLEGRANSQEVYVTGVISAQPEAPSLNKGNRGVFYLTDGVCEENLYVYGINDVGGGTFSSVDKLVVGYTVVAKGAIKKYESNGSYIFEFCYVQNVASCELISISAPAVPVESVTVSPGSLNLDLSDDPAQLSAAVLPDNATDKAVTWHSSNESVAVVSEQGLVTAIGPGAAEITASAGGVTSNVCNVSVTAHVQSVSITESLNLVVGDTGNVVVSVLPENAEDATYTLESQNTNVATVDANGVVTAVASGQTTILVTTTDGSKTDECTVTVTDNVIPVDSVEVVGDLSRSMDLFAEADLEAHGMPANATQDRSVVWTKASGESVEITSAGHVTAIAEGVSVVRATSVISEDYYADVTITVSKVAVTSVSVKASTTIQVGQTETLTATVLPANASYPTVTWSSSDDSVAEVDANGVVTAISVGTATITAIADGESASCVVTVEPAEAVNTVKLAYEGAVAGSKDTFTFAGTVVSMTGNSYVLQDGAYGINIYNKATEGIGLGKLVEVVSTVKLYNGCPQTDSITSAEVTGDGVPQTSAPVTNKADLDALNHNVLAHADDAVFVSKNGDWASGSSKQFVFDIGGNNITVQFDKQGYDAAKAAIANAAIAGAHYELTGLITAAYSGNNQFTFTGTSGIVKTADAPAADPSSVSITTTASTLEVGKTLTLEATVSPANAAQDITWSIEEGGSYATLSGNVLTGVADGDVKVRATATGFASVYAEKTITVSSSVVPTEQSVYVLDGTVAGTGSAYDGDGSATQNGVEWLINGNLTMNPWRIGGKYKDGNGDYTRLVKSKAVVSSDNISKIELTVGAASGVTVNSLKLLVGTSAGAKDISEVTVTFAASSTITISRPSGDDWTGRYFTLEFSVTISSTSNRFIEFKKAEFFAVK